MSGFEDVTEWAGSSQPANLTGDLQAAVQILDEIRGHLERNELDQAVERYENCSQDVGAQLEAEFSRAPRKFQQRMANLFFRARDYARAAACCEEIQEWSAAAQAHAAAFQFTEAAECYMRAGDRKRAASELQRAGHHERAAELFLELGDPVGAAQAYESGGEFMTAASLYLSSSEANRAAQVLARVPPTDPGFGDAMSKLADLLVDLGRVDLALQRLSVGLPRDRVVRELNEAAIAYRYGVLLSEQGRDAEALDVFKMVAAYDLGFEDVAARLEAGGLDPTAIAHLRHPTIPPPRRTSIPPPRFVTQPGGVPPRASFAPQRPSAAPPPQLAGAALPSLGPIPRQPLPVLGSNALITSMPGYDFLKNLPIFQELSLDEMRDFYHLCDQILFEPGQLVIEQGHPGPGLFLVREGYLRITRLVGSREVEIAVLEAGSFVGDMSLFDNAPTSARVTAGDRVKALFIPKERFENYLMIHERVALRVYRTFVRHLAERLREANEKLGNR